MKDESDILMMYNNTNNLDYTGIGDKSSKRKTFFTKKLPELVNEIENKISDEIIDNSDNLEGHGKEKFIIPSNIFDMYTRLEVLLGLKPLSHTNTLTETSNLIDELHKRGEKQNEQHNRKALNKFHTN